MYDVYTLSSVDYSFTYEEALKKAEEACSLGWRYLSRVKLPLASVGLMSMKTKASVLVPYSGGSYDTNAFMLLNWQE